MKKLLSFALSLAGALTLSGCAAPVSEVNAPPPEVIELPIIKPENLSISAGPNLSTLTAPPELSVSTINDTDHVTALQYGFSWLIKQDDGSTSNMIACGPHPLDDPGEGGWATLYTAFPAGSLPPLEEGQMPGGQLPGMILPTYYLDFGDIQPEAITVQRWPVSCIGHASDHYDDGEEVTVERSDGGISLFPLGDGEFIYEVHAVWGEVGDIYYVFRTIPQVREET